MTSKKAPAKKAAAKKTTPAKAESPKSDRGPARTTSRRPPRRPRAGTVAASVFDELDDAGLLLTAAGATALRVARSVDEAESPNAVAVAARELRMQLHSVRMAAAALPPLPGDETEDETPEDEVARMRERSHERRRSS